MTNCSRCGRPLSNPDSVARGMGPVCAGKGGSGFTPSAGSRLGLITKPRSSELLSGTIKKVAADTVVTGLSTVFPPILPIYGTYRLIKVGKSIYSAINNSRNKDKIFAKIRAEAVKYGTSEASKRISQTGF